MLIASPHVFPEKFNLKKKFIDGLRGFRIFHGKQFSVFPKVFPRRVFRKRCAILVSRTESDNMCRFWTTGGSFVYRRNALEKCVVFVWWWVFVFTGGILDDVFLPRAAKGCLWPSTVLLPECEGNETEPCNATCGVQGWQANAVSTTPSSHPNVGNKYPRGPASSQAQSRVGDAAFFVCSIAGIKWKDSFEDLFLPISDLFTWESELSCVVQSWWKGSQPCNFIFPNSNNLRNVCKVFHAARPPVFRIFFPFLFSKHWIELLTKLVGWLLHNAQARVRKICCLVKGNSKGRAVFLMP